MNDNSAALQYIQNIRNKRLEGLENGRSTNTSEGITGSSNGVTDDNARISDVSKIIRRTIPRGTGYGAGSNTDTETTSRISNGRISGIEDSKRSRDGVSNATGSEYSRITGSNSSINQRDQPNDTISAPRVNTFTSKFKPLRDAFKASEKKEAVKKKPVGVDTRKLTDSEALKLRPKLVDGILWQSEHMDELLRAITKGHDYVEIWSDLDKNDAEILADFMIARGRVDTRAAVAVRQIAAFMDNLKLGMIVLPRMYKTVVLIFSRGLSLK